MWLAREGHNGEACNQRRHVAMSIGGEVEYYGRKGYGRDDERERRMHGAVVWLLEPEWGTLRGKSPTPSSPLTWGTRQYSPTNSYAARHPMG